VTDYRLAGSARFNPAGTRVAFALAKGEPTAEQGWVAVSAGLGGQATLVATSPAGHFYQVAGWLNDLTLVVQDVGTVCPTGNCDSVWSMSLDGSHQSKLADGDFLTLVGAP
jgi:tricorn protease-like protein